MQASLERWSERCNPILVKDVRAAFRGRTFKVMLWAVVFIALVVSFGFVAFASGMGDTISGPGYFAAVFGCLALAVHGVVPFSALHSLGAEREENTLELLQLSGMAAWRLVFGKWASALVQAALVYSSFLPFLVFAFLLRGMPVESILAVLVTSAAVCTAQCAAGLALGSLASTRWARVVVSVVFLLGLLYTSPIILMVFLGGAFAGAGVASMGIATIVIIALTAAIGCVTLAAVVLAHAEENRSTPIRIATTFVFLVGCGFAAFANSIETATILLVVTVLCITPSLFFVTTEKERLPRAVAARVGGPTRFLLPLAAWLPGGGRGALYAGFHLSAALFAQLSIGWFVFGEPARFDGQFMRLFATVMVLCVFLLLPSGMLSPYANKPHAVAFSRFLIVIGAVAVLLVPVIVRVLTGFDELMHWSLVERPFDIDPSGKPRAFGPWLLLVGLAVLALTVNIPRVVASFGELRECAERSRAKVSSGAATDA